jgi:apolipoprotein N-acyltransferase
VSRAGRAGLAAGYVLTTFLSFPQPVAGRVLDLGLALAWLSPAFLILLVRDLPVGRAAVFGFGASLAAHTAVIHWIYVVTVVYGHAPVIVGLFAPVLLAGYCACFAGLFGAAFSALHARGRASPFAAAALWTALDHLRSWEFPWATLGYAQHENPALLPLAAFGGVYALSFVTVLGAAALVELVGGRARRAVPALVGVLAAHGLGLLLPPAGPGPDAPALRVAVLQGNIDQGVKWSDSWAEETLRIYESLTREAVAAGAELVVWPETAVPGAIQGNARIQGRLAALAVETGAALIVGGVGLELDAAGRPARYYDSAFSFTKTGQLTDRYDKAHLVPFGEYVPAPLRPFIGAVASGATAFDVSAGERPRGMDLTLHRIDPTLHGMDPELHGVRAGVVVCYELLFPDLVRRFAADGSALLLAITNDAWYGRTGAPYQFLAMTALRSAETGLWTARSANTGISGFIDSRGRVVEQTPIFERAWRLREVPLHPDPRSATFYVRFGDAFAWGCWAAAALLGFSAWRVRRADE